MKRLPLDSSPTQFHSSSPSGGDGDASTSHEPTYKDPMVYMLDVSNIFQDNPEKMDLFHQVILDYQAQRIDTTGVVERVKELLKGYNNLLYGFNIFLPQGYKISVPEDDKLPPMKTPEEVGGVVSFVTKVKERFRNDNQVYNAFLNSLKSYRKGDKDIDQVYNEVTSLLDGHPDLLSDFDDIFREKL